MLKNVIFDLGGVIINIDYDLAANEFKKLGAQNFEKVYAQVQQDDLFELYEMGKITSHTVRTKAKELLVIEHISDQEFDRAWNSIIVDLPQKRLDLVRKFKNKYNTCLLSNINELHFHRTFTICRRDTGLENFSDFFHKEYYSHLVGMRKPDPEIFRLVLRENNLQPQETLFVDDTLKNILSAQSLGIKTHHITLERDIFSLASLL